MTPQDGIQEALDDDRMRYTFSIFLEENDDENIEEVFGYFLNGSIQNLSVHTVVDNIDSIIFSTDRYSCMNTINTTWNPTSGIQRQIIFEKVFFLELDKD